MLPASIGMEPWMFAEPRINQPARNPVFCLVSAKPNN